MADQELAEILSARTLELCRIPSVIGSEQAIADHLERWARQRFPASQVYRLSHTLVLGAPKLDDRLTVGLYGHVDTVPAHPDDPEPRIDGDFVVGLGSSDMKGGLAVMQLLAERLNRRSAAFNVVWVFYEREEGPYLENGLGPLFQARRDLEGMDFAICLEPSDNVIQMGCCGSLQARLTFHGKSAHSARPWQGENAIHKAGPLLTKLLERAPHDVDVQGHRFREVMNVTVAQGGRARNVIPEALTLNLNYRFAPHRTVAQAEEQVRAVVGDAASVEFVDSAPAGPVFSDHPILSRLEEATDATITSKQAWTDVARLGAHDIPAVNFGPGESAQAHQARERAPIAQLVEGYRMLERFLS